jgi:RNA-directed DNA polymerase
MKSFAAKCLAVRRVTQDNQGKSTAGVDGIKSLTPKQRLELVETLKLGTKARATRRVMIPKPGKAEKRPLGIPTMYDRALQGLVKQALEPEWEAKFEPKSYGFRPGRSCHDAIGQIYVSINQMPKYVLDADIAKCFDKINHNRLLEKLNTFPAIRRQVRTWLRAGYILEHNWEPTHAGTPQGGVISPLLANIALHGLEKAVRIAFYPNLSSQKQQNLGVIRYADDFVILHKDYEVIMRCKQAAEAFLSDIGLELRPEKTRIAHTLERIGKEKPGFNFLGFNVRQHKLGKHQSKQGFKTLIKPQSEKVQTHYQKLNSIIVEMTARKQSELIGKLNPIIRGWSNYFRTVVSKQVFSKVDSLLYWSLRRWGKRRHNNKTEKWIRERYWQTIQEGDYKASKFATNERGKLSRLLSHAEIPIVRHEKVKSNKSPFDGDLIYWSARLGEHPEMDAMRAKLLKQQNGKCAYCCLNFMDGDLLETDHKTPKSLGGKDSLSNYQLLHRHCHDKKTANDGSLDKSHCQGQVK